MKLVRFGSFGEEKPGIVDEQNNLFDLSSIIPDFSPSYLNHFDLTKLYNVDLNQLPRIDKQVRIGPCVGSPGKILCVGFNSRAHASEMNAKLIHKKEILVFLKPNSSLCGANDPIIYGRQMQKLDWEAELAMIIGKKGKYIPQSQAKTYILGYACFNDLSERYLQFEKEDKQFTKGKGFDGAAPLGPYLVTTDEIIAPNQLQIKLWVNGQLRQDFSVKDYIHNVNKVISYLSQYFTLYPGDVISMGSGPGSASLWGNAYLNPQDEVTLSISGLGLQSQKVIRER